MHVKIEQTWINPANINVAVLMFPIFEQRIEML